MKISAFLTAAALTCSAAFAAQNSADRDRATDKPSATAGAKTKQALKRAGQKVRETGQRIASAGRKATNRDDQADVNSQSMGAAGSDNARRARMDEAYANWKSRQK
jgi:hypothetical protein